MAASARACFLRLFCSPDTISASFRPFPCALAGKSIVGDAFGATFNFIVAYALFFGVGVVTFDKYGYDDNTVPADNGSYASGPFGPGSFIITTILFILANVIWISKMVYNFSNNAIYFRAERAAAKQAAQDRRAREQAALHAERMESAKARATATA